MPGIRKLGIIAKRAKKKRDREYNIPRLIPSVNRPVSVWCPVSFKIDGTWHSSPYINYYWCTVWEFLQSSPVFQSFKLQYRTFRPLKVSTTVTWSSEMELVSEHGTYSIHCNMNWLHNTPCGVSPLGGMYYVAVANNLGLATAPPGRMLKQILKLDPVKQYYTDAPTVIYEFGTIHSVAAYDNFISPFSSNIPIFARGQVRVKVLFTNPFD